MPDKLARARHIKHDESKHAASKQGVHVAVLDAGHNAVLDAAHNNDIAGVTHGDGSGGAHDATPGSTHDTPDGARLSTVQTSAGIMSACVLLSRITGFARTWAMAFALGSSFLSSSYQVANNLPNMLYELVMAGMLVTAFLPVYISVKKRLGTQAGNEYASNLLSIVVVIMGAVSIISMLFPSAIVYTQSFYSNQDTMTTAVFLFQFFAIQMVFYGASSIISGLLNANRNYFWSTFAPVANNIIVITTFVLYTAIAPANQQAALYIIAIGNPLGVVAQVAIQLPALKKNGIRLRFHINLHDPALKDTLLLGAPTIVVMICSFITVSVMNAASYCFAEDGPSIIAYARLWYALPYSLLAIPITTALFTELTHLHEDGDDTGFIRVVAKGTSRIMFLLIVFALYLVVFATPLVTLYHFGAFTMENVTQIAAFLCALAAALPFYGVSSYLQKVFSSLRKMGVYAAASVAASVAQVFLTMLAVVGIDAGLPLNITSIAWASVAFYLVADVVAFAYLKKSFGHIGFRHIARATILGLLLGGLGALGGFGVLSLCEVVLGEISGSILQAFIYIVLGGLTSLFITFGLASKLHIEEASFVTNMAAKIKEKIKS